MSGLMDDPNRQAVGLEPIWTGADAAATPKAAGRAAGEEPTLDDMSKAELLDYARDIGASPANHDMTKDELRASIDAKLNEG